MLWASRWSGAWRTVYGQILPLLYSFFLLKLPPPARLGTTEDFFSIAAECSGVSASYSFGVFREFWANWGGSREQDPGSVSRGLESGRGSAHFEGSGFY